MKFTYALNVVTVIKTLLSFMEGLPSDTRENGYTICHKFIYKFTIPSPSQKTRCSVVVFPFFCFLFFIHTWVKFSPSNNKVMFSVFFSPVKNTIWFVIISVTKNIDVCFLNASQPINIGWKTIIRDWHVPDNQFQTKGLARAQLWDL